MPEITVTLDGQQHRILGDEKTYCALVVPQGTEWTEEVINPCPVCFPDADKPNKVATTVTHSTTVNGKPAAKAKKKG